jgi:hypothetical protein
MTIEHRSKRIRDQTPVTCSLLVQANVSVDRAVTPFLKRLPSFKLINCSTVAATKAGQDEMGEFETSNGFYQKLTSQAQNKFAESAHIVNPIIDSLDPEVFEVAAKKKSLMWESQQYRDEDQRKALNQTTNRGAQGNIDQEIAEKLRETKFNLKVTNISEYSNACNRGRVFTNPKFSSC